LTAPPSKEQASFPHGDTYNGKFVIRVTINSHRVSFSPPDNHPVASKKFLTRQLHRITLRKIGTCLGGAKIASLVAVAFLLRTHIKVERNPTGKWRFLIEHKPADSKLLTALLRKLEQLFGTDGG
jgi:hypothetical protein